MEEKYIDIGVNLTDEMFAGIYNGRYAHPPDLSHVLQRAYAQGVEKIIGTGGRLEDAKQLLELTRDDPHLFFTVGVHPTRCNDFERQGEGEGEGEGDSISEEEKERRAEQHLIALKAVCDQAQGKVVAVGEFGLDYDRLNFCSQEVQKKYFERQFWLAEQTGLPLFLHMRSACADFAEIIKRNRHRFPRGGVVHSFTGSVEEMHQLIALDLYIGINGCSLKTEENLQVIKELPLERLMLETDAPWCDIRATHAGKKQGYVKTEFASVDKKKHAQDKCVKGRNEPVHIVQVAQVIAGAKRVPLADVTSAAYANTMRVFFP